eukprot:474518_1
MAQTKSWALFAKHLGSKLNDDELNDVVFTFGSDGKEQEETIIKANRGLLSILSPVFKSMFKNGMKESLNDDAIPIQDSDSKSFKLFIQYFYGMDPQVTPDNVGALSYLAEKYLVDGLQNICALFLAESMSIQNVIPILEALHAYHQEVTSLLYVCSHCLYIKSLLYRSCLRIVRRGWPTKHPLKRL